MNTRKEPRANRRLASRKSCQLAVQYLSKGHWHPATAVDLSRIGCRLRLGETLVRTARLTVAIDCSCDDNGAPLHAEVEGHVVWTRLEGLSYQCGIQFDKDVPELQAIVDILQ
jgi:hypothetical protein